MHALSTFCLFDCLLPCSCCSAPKFRIDAVFCSPLWLAVGGARCHCHGREAFNRVGLDTVIGSGGAAADRWEGEG